MPKYKCFTHYTSCFTLQDPSNASQFNRWIKVFFCMIAWEKFHFVRQQWMLLLLNVVISPSILAEKHPCPTQKNKSTLKLASLLSLKWHAWLLCGGSIFNRRCPQFASDGCEQETEHTQYWVNLKIKHNAHSFNCHNVLIHLVNNTCNYLLYFTWAPGWGNSCIGPMDTVGG